jgi:hypothetical protein
MELDEDKQKVMQCEKEPDKYEKRIYKFKIEEKDIEVNEFSKKKEVKDEGHIIENIKKNAEENEVSKNEYKPLTNKSISIGIVVYLEANEYKENPEENANIHIPECQSPSILAPIFKKVFELKYKSNIKELIVGHEHGDINKKCHLQMIVTYKKEFQKKLEPGALKIYVDNKIIKLVYMQQKAKNPHALKNYCKKDRDATIVRGEEYIKFDKEAYAKGDPFMYIYENRDNISKEEARELVIKSDASLYFRNFNNINNAIDKIVCNKPPCEFSWQPVPLYLKNLLLPNGFNFYDVFNEWYTTYCINGEQLERKKALCIYSEKRSMGKSYFVRHLVPHEDYLLEFNNTICQKKNLGKGIYRLLLLDDMKIISEANMAMWKSLVASEPTTLRGAWVNEEYNERLPCIITTNDIEMVRIFRDHKLFNTQVIILEITEYMGEQEGIGISVGILTPLYFSGYNKYDK